MGNRLSSDRKIVAQDAWGDDLPEWIAVLVRECDCSSQNKVANRLNLSAATVSQVIRKCYLGSYDNVLERVQEIYLNDDVECPPLGLITSEVCLFWRDEVRNGTSIDPMRTLLTRFCRKCPRNVPKSTKAAEPTAPEPEVKLFFKSRRSANAPS